MNRRLLATAIAVGAAVVLPGVASGAPKTSDIAAAKAAATRAANAGKAHGWVLGGLTLDRAGTAAVADLYKDQSGYRYLRHVDVRISRGRARVVGVGRPQRFCRVSAKQGSSRRGDTARCAFRLPGRS